MKIENEFIPFEQALDLKSLALMSLVLTYNSDKKAREIQVIIVWNIMNAKFKFREGWIMLNRPFKFGELKQPLQNDSSLCIL